MVWSYWTVRRRAWSLPNGSSSRQPFERFVLLSKVNFLPFHQFHLKPTCGDRAAALHIRMDKIGQHNLLLGQNGFIVCGAVALRRYLLPPGRFLPRLGAC